MVASSYRPSGAQRKHCFSVHLFPSFPSLPLSSLLKNTHNTQGTDSLAEKDLPTSKSGKRAGDMALAWEPLLSPQEVSPNEVFVLFFFLSAILLCVFFFCSLGRGQFRAHRGRGHRAGAVQWGGPLYRPTAGPLISSAKRHAWHWGFRRRKAHHCPQGLATHLA